MYIKNKIKSLSIIIKYVIIELLSETIKVYTRYIIIINKINQ